MLDLLKVEFFIQKKYIKTSLIVLVFISMMFLMNRNISMIYIMAPFITFYLCITSIEVEKRSNFNVYINSLGISKTEYVGTKYISGFVYFLVANIGLYGIYKVISIFVKSKTTIDLSIAITAISFSLIYIAFILPVMILLNYKYHRIANIVLTLIVMIITTNIMENMNGNIMESMSIITKPIFLLIAIITYIISFIFSSLVYIRKDVR